MQAKKKKLGAEGAGGANGVDGGSEGKKGDGPAGEEIKERGVSITPYIIIIGILLHLNLNRIFFMLGFSEAGAVRRIYTCAIDQVQFKLCVCMCIFLVFCLNNMYPPPHMTHMYPPPCIFLVFCLNTCVVDLVHERHRCNFSKACSLVTSLYRTCSLPVNLVLYRTCSLPVNLVLYRTCSLPVNLVLYRTCSLVTLGSRYKI